MSLGLSRAGDVAGRSGGAPEALPLHVASDAAGDEVYGAEAAA